MGSLSPPVVVAATLAAVAVLAAGQRAPASRRLARLAPFDRAPRPRAPVSCMPAAGPAPPVRAPARAPGVSRAGRAGLATAAARASAALLAGVGMAALLGGVTGVAAGLVLAGVLGRWLRGLEPADVARRRERLRADLPLAADLLHACVVAGTPPGQAVEVVAASVGGPLGEVLAAAQARCRLGVDPATAWAAVALEEPLRPLARALAAAGERGASPVDALRQAADDARDAARRHAEARARGLGARAAAPLGLCFLPAFVLVGVVPLVGSVLPPLP